MGNQLQAERLYLAYKSRMFIVRNWLKTVFFISSLSPTLLVAAAVRIYSDLKIDITSIQLIIISILGTLLPILIFMLLRRESEVLTFKAKKVKSADYFLLVFLASYASPIVMKIVQAPTEASVAIAILVCLAASVISNIPSHPVLYIFKYRFYEVESDDGMIYTLITKRNLRTPSSISRVIRISNNMIME